MHLRQQKNLFIKRTASHAGLRAGPQPLPALDLKGYLESRTAAVNRALDQFLPRETAKPATIHKSMRYSLFAGGKRMRPALCLAAATACGGRGRDALPLAGAGGWIHTHSLIPDRLPAMGDDDFRRGEAANHKGFGG